MKLNPHPSTHAIPENRRGTRTYRGYARHCAAGNGLAGGMAALLASPKQEAAARKLYERGTRPSQVNGRVLRAVLASMHQFYDFDDIPF